MNQDFLAALTNIGFVARYALPDNQIKFSEYDSKIKIILKDLSNKNEITRKLLIGYTELFSE